MKSVIATMIFLLGLPGGVSAWAQPKQDTSAPPVGLQRCTPDIRGMHSQKVTVVSIDSETGVVRLKADNMPLVVQFPPSSLAGIKPGETLDLHLGFTRGSEGID